MTSTKFLMANTSNLKMFDARGTTLIDEKAATLEYRLHGHYFDNDRNLYWAEDYNRKIVICYDVTDTTIIERFRVTVSASGGNQSITVDPTTGNAYHVSTGTVSKIDLITQTIASTLTFLKAASSRSLYPSILYIPVTDEIYVINQFKISTTLAVVNSFQFNIFDKELLGVENVYDRYNIHRVQNYQYLTDSNSYTSYATTNSKFASFNPISNQIVMNNTGTSLLEYYKFANTLEFWDVKKRRFEHTVFLETDKSSVHVGKTTGNIYVLNINGGTKYNFDGEKIATFRLLGNKDTRATFNDVAEIFYIGDDVNNSTFVYNNVGDLLNVIPYDYISGIPLIYKNEVPVSNISSSVVVSPTNFETITDETPTIVFKVGYNPVNWTQQFRFVADTNENVITAGNPDDLYTIKLDSWLSSVDYLAATWEYSLDNVTWLALGTGDGLKNGGVVPTNGVDASVGDVWVRLTLPATHPLTNVGVGTNWFLKIFSYSKN